MRKLLLVFSLVTLMSSAGFAQKNFEGYYRLKTMYRGNGESLEGNAASSKVHGGAAFMDKDKNVSGQMWKLEKVDYKPSSAKH